MAVIAGADNDRYTGGSGAGAFFVPPRVLPDSLTAPTAVLHLVGAEAERSAPRRLVETAIRKLDESRPGILGLVS